MSDYPRVRDDRLAEIIALEAESNARNYVCDVDRRSITFDLRDAKAEIARLERELLNSIAISEKNYRAMHVFKAERDALLAEVRAARELDVCVLYEDYMRWGQVAQGVVDSYRAIRAENEKRGIGA